MSDLEKINIYVPREIGDTLENDARLIIPGDQPMR